VSLQHWAARYGISREALADLADILGATPSGAVLNAGASESEARVQSRVRLLAPMVNMRLFRNNVGALLDARGVPVRFGLANDSKVLNRKLKSGDLIGWERVSITPDLLGSTIARFVSFECKPSDWKYTGDEHEQAQQNWAALVVAEGGRARFIREPGDIVA